MSVLTGKATWLVGLVLLCVGLVVGLGVGSTVEDADAAKKKELKTLWAVVSLDTMEEPVMVRAKGATNVVKLSEGTFEVSFNRNVSNCAYGVTSSELFAAVPSVDEGPNPSSVTVYTVGGDGLHDAPFHLQVTC
jgi:hypothetical protein